MTTRRSLAAAVLVAILAAGCQGSDQPEQSGPTTTQDPTPAVVPQTTRAGQTTAAAVIADLRAHGFEVTGVKETTAELSGAREVYDVRIDGVEAGVLTFPDVEAAQSWAETGESFGAIAVVGDTWAISLDSDESGGTTRAESRALARRIAAEVGGTVR